MLNFLDKYNFIKGRECWGLEMIFTSKDNYTLVATELITEKEGIAIKRRFTDIRFEELKKINTKNAPIYLSISGRGIIYKQIEHSDATEQQQLLRKVLPNANLIGFELQILPVENNKYWVTVARKELIDDILSQAKSSNLFVVQVYLGPFAIANVIPLIESDTIQTLSNEITLNDKQIIAIDSLGDVSAGIEYEIEGEIINSYELVAFSTALNHFVATSSLVLCSPKQVIDAKAEFLHKKKCGAVSLGLACLFLLVVISNLVIQNHVEHEYNTYQYQALSKKEAIEELSKLKMELTTKEQFVQNSGITKASMTPYFVDQIALSVPQSVQLDQLFIHPIQKKINKAEDILFDYNNIKIAGKVNKSIELNDWVQELRTYNWVEDINIIRFNQENLRTPGEFELQLRMKP